MKTLALLFCTVLFLKGGSQNAKALTLYNEAVIHFNEQHYRQADSLFTLSNKLESSSETVFNRAICRGKMADKNGYCSDLANASNMGKEKATQLFVKTCGTIDTVFTPVVQNYSPAHMVSRKITYTYNDSVHLVMLQKYYGQERVKKEVVESEPVVTQDATPVKQVEQMAEFPGGMIALMNYVRKNIRIPSSLSSENDSPKVFVRFTIDSDGSIYDIIVVKDIPGCKECSEEASRLVAAMPAWKPATMKGMPVKMYYNLPISFRTYN